MSKRSRVHPPYKTKYRVRNWAEYERGLAARGSLTFWISPDALRDWEAKHTGRPGAQPRYSDLAIETVVTPRMVFPLPLRQAEDFVTSLLHLLHHLKLDLEAPNHAALSWQARTPRIRLRRPPLPPDARQHWAAHSKSGAPAAESEPQVSSRSSDR